MEKFGLKNMRMTVVAFGPTAYEIYFLSFGKSTVGFIPEIPVCACGWGEAAALSAIRNELVSRGLVTADSEHSEVEAVEPASTKKSSKKIPQGQADLF